MDKTKPKPVKRGPARTSGAKTPAKKPADAPGHRERFDQLLDDVVFGKPTKR